MAVLILCQGKLWILDSNYCSHHNKAKFSPLFVLVLQPREQIWMCENYVNVKLDVKVKFVKFHASGKVMEVIKKVGVCGLFLWEVGWWEGLWGEVIGQVQCYFRSRSSQDASGKVVEVIKKVGVCGLFLWAVGWWEGLWGEVIGQVQCYLRSRSSQDASGKVVEVIKKVGVCGLFLWAVRWWEGLWGEVIGQVQCFFRSRSS